MLIIGDAPVDWPETDKASWNAMTGTVVRKIPKLTEAVGVAVINTFWLKRRHRVEDGSGRQHARESERRICRYTFAGASCDSAGASFSKSEADVSRFRLVSRCIKVCSLTGLPALFSWLLPFCPFRPLGVGGAIWGIFSGLGCSRPT